MTPEQFLEAMRQIYPENGIYEFEAAHGEADDLMCDLLTQLGYGAAIEIFKDAERWYA